MPESPRKASAIPARTEKGKIVRKAPKKKYFLTILQNERL